MTAIEEAARLYAAHGMNLSEDLERYLKFGYVFVTPDRLMLGRPMLRERGAEYWPQAGEGDAWYVRLAVGKGAVRWFVEQMPYYLPFLAWNRQFKDNGRLHIWPTDKFANRLIRGN